MLIYGALVQEKLAANRKARALAVGAKAPSLLSGLIFDGDGNRMTPTHANKRGRRYRYYISASLLDRGKPGAGTMRVPASEVEGLVLDKIRGLLASQNAVGSALAPLALDARELQWRAGTRRASQPELDRDVTRGDASAVAQLRDQGDALGRSD